LFVKRVKRSTVAGVFSYAARGDRQWGVDYRDPTTGRRKRKVGFRSKEKALRFKEKADKQRLGVEPLDPESKTVAFEIGVARYIEDRLARGRGIRSYQHLVLEDKKGKRPGFWWEMLGKRKLTSIKADEVESLLEERARAKSWAPATRNMALRQISGFFTYARRRGWIEHHPIDHGRIPRLPEDNARTRWLRLHEIEAIAQHSPEWLRVIVKFAVATGMRLGEICHLTRASYQTDETDRAYVITEKTKNGERLIWPLEGWPKSYVERRVAATSFPAQYLFPGPGGGLAYMSVKKYLPSAVKAAGLKYGRKYPDGVTFHTFRHSMASLALNYGVPEAVVQRMGNWKTRLMVDRYAHLADESLRAGAATLAELVGGSSKKKPRRTIGGVVRKSQSATRSA
jgi:integrase